MTKSTYKGLRYCECMLQNTPSVLVINASVFSHSDCTVYSKAALSLHRSGWCRNESVLKQDENSSTDTQCQLGLHRLWTETARRLFSFLAMRCELRFPAQTTETNWSGNLSFRCLVLYIRPRFPTICSLTRTFNMYYTMPMATYFKKNA